MHEILHVIAYFPERGGLACLNVTLLGMALSPSQAHGMQALLMHKFVEKGPQVTIFLQAPRPALGQAFAVQDLLGFAKVSH